MSKRSRCSLGPTIAQQNRAHERLMARRAKPIKPLPPMPPNLTPADLEAIREIADTIAAEIGRQLREMLSRTP